MPERKKMSLTEILEAFSKEASDEVEAAPVAVPQATTTEVVTPNDPLVSAAKQVVEAANSLKMDEDTVESAAKRVAENTEKLDGAAEALKAIAKEAAENHETAMQKEAQLFGQIFAAAVLNEFEKNAHVSAAEEAGYNAVFSKVAEEELSVDLQKVAEEAYIMCLVKLAYDEGYAAVTPEQVAQPVAPEMVAAPQPQEPTDPNSPFIPQAPAEAAQVVPEPAAVAVAEPDGGNLEAATEAVQDAAQAAKAVAQAAQAAVEAATGSVPAVEGGEAQAPVEGDELEPSEEEVAEALPKVAHDAYMITREFLEKRAEAMAAAELDEVLSKVAQEAYEIAFNLE